MKLLCGAAKHANMLIEVPVKGDNTNIEYGGDGGHSTKMVICAMDYPHTDNQLSCTIDADNMQQLAQACNVQFQTLTDRQQPLTKELAQGLIQELLSRCEEGDTFVFYYSGHGTQLGQTDGGEEADNEEDDAYCFQDESGQIDFNSCWSDDDFSEFLSDQIPEGVNVIVLSDCCHSDTICDFSKQLWKDKEAISISGCLDKQTSGDIGKGGIFTHSMLLAIDKINQAKTQGENVGNDDGNYSVGYLFNATLKQKQKYFESAAQQISIEHSSATQNDRICWPLIPQGSYNAPLNSGGGQTMSYGAPPAGGVGSGAVPPNVLDALSLGAEAAQQMGLLEDDDLP